jgi:hypothetical protein
MPLLSVKLTFLTDDFMFFIHRSGRCQESRWSQATPTSFRIVCKLSYHWYPITSEADEVCHLFLTWLPFFFICLS